jgi:NTE family protein
MQPPQTSPTALVMTGGGARAAYQVGVLRAIARRWPEFFPPVITGVSAGAINAIALAGRQGSFAEAVGLLSRLWGGLKTEDVFRADAPSLTRLGLRWTRQLFSGGQGPGQKARGLVDTAPLRELITRVIQADGGVDAVERNIYSGQLDAFGITATNYGTGRSVTWVQGRNVRAWDRPGRHSLRDRIGVEHVMASSALPFIFPAIRVGGAWYGDGGIRQIAPLSPVIHLGAARILAVNTRYARTVAEAERPAVADYPPPAQIMGVLMNAVFLDSMDQDAMTTRYRSRLARLLPEGERGELRPVDLLVIRPSQDLGRLAAEYEFELPGPFRFLMRGLGTQETDSPDWLSMLLFEPAFLQRLMEIGEADAEARIEEIGEFLGLAYERPYSPSS